MEARAYSRGTFSYNVGARGEVSRQDFRFRNDNGTPILNRYDDFDDERRNAGYRKSRGSSVDSGAGQRGTSTE